MAVSNPTSVTPAVSVTSGTTVVSASFTPTAGNRLIVAGAGNITASGWTASITDSWSLTWTAVATGSTLHNGGGAFDGGYLWVSSPVPSSPSAGTITVTASATITGFVCEYYTVSGASGVGATGVTDANGAGTSVNASLSAAPAAGSLVIATASNDNGAGAVTITGPSGWTSSAVQKDSTNRLEELFSYKNGSASQSNTWTFSGTANNGMAVAVVEITASASGSSGAATAAATASVSAAGTDSQVGSTTAAASASVSAAGVDSKTGAATAAAAVSVSASGASGAAASVAASASVSAAGVDSKTGAAIAAAIATVSAAGVDSKAGAATAAATASVTTSGVLTVVFGIATAAAVATVSSATVPLSATYTVLQGVTWRGWLPSGSIGAVTFTTGQKVTHPTDDQAYALDYFLVPEGFALNPLSHSGPGYAGEVVRY